MPKTSSPVSRVWHRPVQLFKDRRGLVHICGGSYGANSLMKCESSDDETGGLDLDLRGMTEVFDEAPTCLRCVAQQ